MLAQTLIGRSALELLDWGCSVRSESEATVSRRPREGFAEYLAGHLAGLENAERVEALAWYCQGLSFEGEAKTALGLAAAMKPTSVQATRQRMQRALQLGRFQSEQVFERLQQTVFESGQVQAYCVDDTGIPKKGDCSVGVERQYTRNLDEIANCQVIVSLHGISNSFAACLGLRLHLPESWCHAAQRRAQTSVPAVVTFQRKWEIALSLLDAVQANGGPGLPVLADAAYGDCSDFRRGLRKRCLKYVVGVSSKAAVWLTATKPAGPYRPGLGGQAREGAAAEGSEPAPIEVLARELLAARAFVRVGWRAGTKGALEGEFAAVRVRCAERRTDGAATGDDEWLLIEREMPDTFNYYLSSLSSRCTLASLVRLAKMGWHMDTEYQHMKHKLGFHRYEGRSWGGLHRHLSMVALVHAFIALHTEVVPSAEVGVERDGGELRRQDPGVRLLLTQVARSDASPRCDG